jgi:hypothetical protein
MEDAIAHAQTVDALQAVGITHAWLVPAAAGTAGHQPSHLVIAAVQPQLASMPDLFEAFDQLGTLEWVLEEVHRRPVTIRFYFRPEAVPANAVPLMHAGARAHLH